MCTVLDSRERGLAARVGVLLIMLALVAGMSGCDRNQYVLTISSTQGGTVVSPDEGALTYPAGATVVLLAQPDPGYRFIGWTGNVRAIKNVNAASTMIAIKGNYSITANFEWMSP
jgi:hypothetical protein